VYKLLSEDLMPLLESSLSANDRQDERGIVDPASGHFQRSSAAYETYDSLVQNDDTSLEYLTEPIHDQMGRSGNPGSRQGFDLDSFRFRG
jgi:hypothetical protein